MDDIGALVIRTALVMSRCNKHAVNDIRRKAMSLRVLTTFLLSADAVKFVRTSAAHYHQWPNIVS